MRQFAGVTGLHGPVLMKTTDPTGLSEAVRTVEASILVKYGWQSYGGVIRSTVIQSL